MPKSTACSSLVCLLPVCRDLGLDLQGLSQFSTLGRKKPVYVTLSVFSFVASLGPSPDSNVKVKN